VRSSVSLALAVLAAASIGGCGSSGIAYQAPSPSAPAARAVALKVIDNRPPKEGGREPNVVGLRRSLVGIKASIKESGPEVVPNLVRAATEDALGRAGVGVSANAKVTLTAQILSFWMDWSSYSYPNLVYKAAVAVEFTLQDASGRVLWKGLAVTEQQHSGDSKEKIFGPALKRLAGRAARRFESAEFVSAVPKT
jgi:hypothetical protein